MNNIVFYLKKGEQIVFHQHTSRKFWIAFFEGKLCEIPSVIINEVDKFFKSKEKELTIENCTECHVLDEENGIEKICYNLSNKDLKWEIKK